MPFISKKSFLIFASVATAAVFKTSDGFIPVKTNFVAWKEASKTFGNLPSPQQGEIQNGHSILRAAEKESAPTITLTEVQGVIVNEKLTLREPTEEERGKGGVEVAPGESIKALEVLARIPRQLIISSVDAPDRAMEAAVNARNLTWATDLTAATLAALHPTEEELSSSMAAASDNDDVDTVLTKKAWVQSWKAGGWATDGVDLGPSDANFGAKDVTGSLIATGTDNDHNIYAKFRMPCHPVLLRASLGLEVLTKCTEEEARDALTARGFTYRSMRDALEPMVLQSTERAKGSKREKRCWDVADTLSRVLSRVTTLQLEASDDMADEDDVTLAYVIAPLHERLEHSVMENSKLVSSGDEVLLVATRDIEGGEPITRDYNSSPQLQNDDSEGALRLLLQFGLPPKAWPTVTE